MVAKQLIAFFTHKMFSLRKGCMSAANLAQDLSHTSASAFLYTSSYSDFGFRLVGWHSWTHRLGFCFSSVQIWLYLTGNTGLNIEEQQILACHNYVSVPKIGNVDLRDFSSSTVNWERIWWFNYWKAKKSYVVLEFLPLEIGRHTIHMQNMQIFTAFLLACVCLSSGKIHQEDTTEKEREENLGTVCSYNKVFVHRRRNILPCSFVSQGFWYSVTILRSTE